MVQLYSRHLAYMIELVFFPSAHPIPQPKGQIDRFSRFHTAHCSVVGNIGATWWIWLNLCFIGPTRVHNPNGKSTGSAILALLTAECCWAHWRHLANTIEHVLPWAHNSNGKSIGYDRKVSLYFTMGCPFPPKIAPSHGGSGPHLNMVPWAHPSPQPKRHLDWFSQFCRTH